jgi:hypothetical protein
MRFEIDGFEFLFWAQKAAPKIVDGFSTPSAFFS